jgi:general secretion pathway protein D
MKYGKFSLSLLITTTAALLSAVLLPAQSFLPPTNVITSALPSAPSAPPAVAVSSPEQSVSIQFPHTSVADVLTLYEKLTGKRIIRDSNLAGPEISILVANPVPQSEAVAMIESSLLLNGYTLIPVDGKTVKILGPSRPPRSEGLPLYLEESELPQEGDKLVSFYKNLRFLSPDEAITIIQGVVQLNAYGSIVAVPNMGAIVITEKTPLIRKAIAVLDVVDREPTQIITEFIPLQRANAEKVVDTLNQMFGKESGSSGTHAGGQPQGTQGAVVSGGSDTHLLSGKAEFVAEKRTNRVLIVVKAENYKYVRELIAKLDQPVDLDQPLVRPLNYISVTDIFPVLEDMLKGKDDDEKSSSSGGSTQPQAPQQSQSQNSSSSSGSSGSSGGVSETPDRLSDEAKQSAPQSVTIGSTSIIADASANSIIVYGPPESKAKAKQIIDLLDQRPKQVYLAAVIGQLQLTDGMNYGATWFARISTSGTNHLIGASVSPTIGGLVNSLSSASLSNAISAFPSSLTGLTVFGTIAQGVATYANFLESTGKFRTLSRPVVYTSNNKKATIFSGQNVPIPGTSSASQVGSSGTNALSSINTTITYQPVVLKLEVIPLINSDKEVNLVIAQRNDSIGASNNIGGNLVPTIETQELTTTVRVPNGSTIVLGGLITDQKNVSDSGIPYIGRIPIIGPLLGGQSNKSRQRSELVIMIQPIVVDSDDNMQKASADEGGVSDLGQKSTALAAQLRPTPTPTPKKKRFQLFGMPKIDNF